MACQNGDVEPVLVVLHASGLVEVFANKRSRKMVRIVNFPIVPGDRVTDAEAWVDERLPASHREIYWPANRVAYGSVEDCVIPAVLLEREELKTWQLNVLAALDDLKEQWSGGET